MLTMIINVCSLIFVSILILFVCFVLTLRSRIPPLCGLVIEGQAKNPSVVANTSLARGMNRTVLAGVWTLLSPLVNGNEGAYRESELIALPICRYAFGPSTVIPNYFSHT